MPASYLLRDAWPAFIGVGGLLLLIGYYVRAWLRVERDPPSRVIVPRYEAPDGQSPASMRFLRRDEVRRPQFRGGSPEPCCRRWCCGSSKESRGLLKRGDKFNVCTGNGAAPRDGCSPTDETGLRGHAARVGAQSIELDNANHAIIAAAKHAHLQLLKKRHTPTFFRINGAWHAGGIALSLLLGAAAIVSPVSNGGFGAKLAVCDEARLGRNRRGGTGAARQRCFRSPAQGAPR